MQRKRCQIARLILLKAASLSRFRHPSFSSDTLRAEFPLKLFSVFKMKQSTKGVCGNV